MPNIGMNSFNIKSRCQVTGKSETTIQFFFIQTIKKGIYFVYSEEQLSLDSRSESLCQQFIGHNLATGNFGSLITVFLSKVSELLELSDKERLFTAKQITQLTFLLMTDVRLFVYFFFFFRQTAICIFGRHSMRYSLYVVRLNI